MVPQGIKPVLQRTAIEVSGHRGEWRGVHGGETQKWEPSRLGGHRLQPALGAGSAQQPSATSLLKP